MSRIDPNQGQFAINQIIAPNAGYDPADMKTVIQTLDKLGYPQDSAENRMFYMPDDQMKNGLLQFQKDQGLETDGIIRPNGPTSRAFNQALLAQNARVQSDALPQVANPDFISPEAGNAIGEKIKPWEGTPYAARGRLSSKISPDNPNPGADCSGSIANIYKEAGYGYGYYASKDFPKSPDFAKIPLIQVPGGKPKPQLQTSDVIWWPGHMAVYDSTPNDGFDVWHAPREGKLFSRETIDNLIKQKGDATYYRRLNKKSK